MNLELFKQKYQIKNNPIEKNQSGFKTRNEELNELFGSLGGISINKGLFKIHSFQSSKKWTEIICEIFPKYTNRISVYGFDWVGRQYAKDLDKDFTYLFDIATGEDFELEQPLSEFFNVDLIEYEEETLNTEEFNEWNKNKIELDFDQIVGYKIPLWLGGEDSINNYEIADAEVYWEINRQLMNK